MSYSVSSAGPVVLVAISLAGAGAVVLTAISVAGAVFLAAISFALAIALVTTSLRSLCRAVVAPRWTLFYRLKGVPPFQDVLLFLVRSK